MPTDAGPQLRQGASFRTSLDMLAFGSIKIVSEGDVSGQRPEKTQQYRGDRPPRHLVPAVACSPGRRRCAMPPAHGRPMEGQRRGEDPCTGKGNPLAKSSRSGLEYVPGSRSGFCW